MHHIREAHIIPSHLRTLHRMFLERYLHYYHRYINHENSKKLESELRDKSLNQMMSMNMNPELSSRNVKIVDEATENLIEAGEIYRGTFTPFRS
jgi:hypothetical protein